MAEPWILRQLHGEKGWPVHLPVINNVAAKLNEALKKMISYAVP